MSPKRLLKQAGCEMKVICGRDWDEFEKTEREGVRFCSGCEKEVFYTRSREELIIAAKKGLCVYIDPGFDITRPMSDEEREASRRAIEAKAIANMYRVTGSVALKRKK